MVTKIYIGNDRLDLYGDENISLTSSIADTQDITKNTTDFTKTFTVPASDINNAIFRHYYDATIDNAFDARTKVDGRIELDGIPFRKGKFRLNKVSVKKGRPSSYTVNFWGNLVSINDKLKKKELIDLDLTAYDHNYNDANVLTGLTSSLFSGAVVYNLLVKKQYYYSSDSDDDTQTDSLANIAFGGGSGVKWNDLRPSLKLIKIIEAIETDYDMTFSRHFFGRAEFQNLYLWLNSDTNKNIGGSVQIVDFDGGSSANVNLTTNIGTFTARATAASCDNITWKLTMTVTPLIGFQNVEYILRAYVDGEVAQETTNTGTKSQVYNISVNGEDTDFEVYFEIETSQDFQYSASLNQRRKSTLTCFTVYTTFITTASANTITSFFTVANNLPKIKLIDFLKGIFNAFKLVVIQLDSGIAYVNTLQSYYDEGVLYNFTTYVDYENIDVSRGNILNEINFNFEDPTTILNEQFKKNTRIAYGDEELQLTDALGEPLDGEKLEFKLPFEQVVYERLPDIFTEEPTQVQYGAIIDQQLEPVNPKAHVFYNVFTDLAGKRIGFLDENSVKTDLGGFINTPSHTETFENQQFAFVFSQEFSTWDGTLISNNLYTNYHQRYVNDIFNIKRRNFKYSAKNIPLNILAELELNDILRIKQDYYRIDNMDINLLTGEAQLNLINAFDLVIGAFTPSETSIYVDYLAQQASIYITFLENFTAVKIDTSDGVGWVTVTNTGSNVFFDFTENDTEFSRNMFVTFTNTDTGQTFDVSLQQEEQIFVTRLDFSKAGNSQYIAPLLTLRT